MYVVSLLRSQDHPDAIRIEIALTYEDAVKAGIQIAKDEDAPDTQKEVERQLQNDSLYTPGDSKYADWSICISQVRPDVAILPKSIAIDTYALLHAVDTCPTAKAKIAEELEAAGFQDHIQHLLDTFRPLTGL